MAPITHHSSRVMHWLIGCSILCWHLSWMFYSTAVLGLDLSVLCPKLLYLSPLKFNCVGGCWDWTQDCCDFDIRLTTRLDLIQRSLKKLYYFTEISKWPKRCHIFSGRVFLLWWKNSAKKRFKHGSLGGYDSHFYFYFFAFFWQTFHKNWETEFWCVETA